MTQDMPGLELLVGKPVDEHLWDDLDAMTALAVMMFFSRDSQWTRPSEEVLLAAIEERDALREQIAAMRPLVEALAEYRNQDEGCEFCGVWDYRGPFQHDPDCSVMTARPLVATWTSGQTLETSEGEAHP